MNRWEPVCDDCFCRAGGEYEILTLGIPPTPCVLCGSDALNATPCEVVESVKRDLEQGVASE